MEIVPRVDCDVCRMLRSGLLSLPRAVADWVLSVANGAPVRSTEGAYIRSIEGARTGLVDCVEGLGFNTESPGFATCSGNVPEDTVNTLVSPGSGPLLAASSTIFSDVPTAGALQVVGQICSGVPADPVTFAAAARWTTASGHQILEEIANPGGFSRLTVWPLRWDIAPYQPTLPAFTWSTCGPLPLLPPPPAAHTEIYEIIRVTTEADLEALCAARGLPPSHPSCTIGSACGVTGFNVANLQILTAPATGHLLAPGATWGGVEVIGEACTLDNGDVGHFMSDGSLMLEAGPRWVNCPFGEGTQITVVEA